MIVSDETTGFLLFVGSLVCALKGLSSRSVFGSDDRSAYPIRCDRGGLSQSSCADATMSSSNLVRKDLLKTLIPLTKHERCFAGVC